MSSPPEHTGKPEDFLSRRYRGTHIPETEAEKLWADAASFQEGLDLYGEDLRSTGRVLEDILKYSRTNMKTVASSSELEEAGPEALAEDTNGGDPPVEYERLTEMLKGLTGRVNYYEKDILGRMERFLTAKRNYKPDLKKAVIAERDETPQTEGRKLRILIGDLQEHLANDRRRLKGLREFVAVDLKFKGFKNLDLRSTGFKYLDKA